MRVSNSTATLAISFCHCSLRSRHQLRLTVLRKDGPPVSPKSPTVVFAVRCLVAVRVQGACSLPGRFHFVPDTPVLSNPARRSFNSSLLIVSSQPLETSDTIHFCAEAWSDLPLQVSGCNSQFEAVKPSFQVSLRTLAVHRGPNGIQHSTSAPRESKRATQILQRSLREPHYPPVTCARD